RALVSVGGAAYAPVAGVNARTAAASAATTQLRRFMLPPLAAARSEVTSRDPEQHAAIVDYCQTSTVPASTVLTFLLAALARPHRSPAGCRNGGDSRHDALLAVNQLSCYHPPNKRITMTNHPPFPATEQVREDGERATETARALGRQAIDAYERAVQGAMQSERAGADAAPAEWIKTAIAAHAAFVAAINAAYVGAARSVIN